MKPRIFINGNWVEFETEAEHNAYVASISPPLDLVKIANLAKSQEHELIGKDVIRELYSTLRTQNLTQAQEADLIGRIINVLIALGFGFIRGARDLANALPIAGQLTTGRKNYLLGKIDEAILML